MGLRLGLAGLGVHGLRYARHLLSGDVDGARLTAVCRRSVAAGRRFADEHGLAFAADPTELVSRGDVDAIVAALPPDLHPGIACAALGAGKPVLVEKPLAPDASAARAVADEVARSGTALMVAQTLRFDPLVQRLKQEAARLGALSLVSIHQRFEPADRPWIDTPGPGGILLNTGVHGFDLMRYLTGLEPASIQARSGCRLTRRTEDHFVATVRLEPGGVLALIDNARTTHSRSGRIELVGEDGQLWGDHIHRTLQRVQGREIAELGPIPAEPTIPRALAAFVRCVREGSPSPVPVTDGVAALEMVDAARRSCDESGSQEPDGATA